MRMSCSTAPVRMGQMCPPFRVKRWLTPARFSARAMSSPVLPESATAFRPRHRGRVEGGVRLAFPGYEDDAADCMHRLAQVLDRAFSDKGRIHAVLQLDDDELGEAQADEGLTLTGAAHRAEAVVRVKTCARNRSVTDPARQLALDATGRDRNE